MSIIACSIDGCEKPKRTRGWCESHYSMWRRNGFPGPVKIKSACTIADCGRPMAAKGYCMMHYLRSKRSPNGVGDASPRHVSGQTTCTHGDCSDKALSLHLCSKHYWRLKEFGPAGLDRISTHDPAYVVSYSAVHWRLSSKRGRAANLPCVDCSQPAQQWSYDHADPGELIDSEGLPYSTDLERYQPRCVSCHTIFDRAHASA